MNTEDIISETLHFDGWSQHFRDHLAFYPDPQRIHLDVEIPIKDEVAKRRLVVDIDGKFSWAFTYPDVNQTIPGSDVEFVFAFIGVVNTHTKEVAIDLSSQPSGPCKFNFHYTVVQDE